MKHIVGPLRNYAILTIIYFVLEFLLPANKVALHEYSLSLGQYHNLLFFVTLPMAVIWFAAFFGYAKLAEYAKLVAETPEGAGFERLAAGFRWLAWGLPIPSLASLVLTAITNSHPGFQGTAVVITNYLNLLFPLIAFIIIGSAAHALIEKFSQKIALRTAQSLQFLFVTMGVLFCYLTFRHLDLHSIGSTNNPFYLPVWLLVITLIIPYLYAWFIGLLAVYDINLLSKHSNGVLYRQALRMLAIGLTIVIASLISVQYLRSVVPRSGHLALSTLLVAVYAFYICAVAGFGILAIGAQRLKRLEEV